MWDSPEKGESFAAWVELRRRHEKGQDLPETWVPYAVFYAFEDDAIAGRVSVRLQLNEFLAKAGGHVGYGVVPAFRRRGVGKALLKHALLHCRGMGIAEVLVTCNEDNLPSAKIIEGCGGVLENVLELGEGQPRKRRYWIDL